MTKPEKVIGFLDVFGAWDPSLMLVMAGAIAVHALAYRIVRPWRTSLTGDALAIPERRPLSAKLFGGAALFGVGWGLAGYCPAPSVVSLATGAPGVVVFVAFTVVGTLAANGLISRRAQGDEARSDADSGELA
jgi:uncharacterized membrane protein YedE/YeeE